MKCRKNIYWLFLLLAGYLISCDKDSVGNVLGEIPEENVPEGYMKVSFIRKEPAGTRAAINGFSSRVKHLRFLLYEKVDGAYKLDKEKSKVVFENQTSVNWPVQKGLGTLLLPRDKEYRVVFLGNVDKSVFGDSQVEEVLTGVEDDGADFGSARIHAPSVAFKANTMYHWGLADFDTDSSHGPEGIDIAVLLERIVSRTVLTTCGIPAGVDFKNATGMDYASSFYYSLLDEGHPLGLGKMVFGSDGLLGGRFLETLKKDIIFPASYALEQQNKLTGATDKKFVQWYNEVKDSYWDRYTEAADLGGTKELIQELLGQASSSSFFSDESDLTIDMLEKLYNKGDIFQAMLDEVKKQDVRYLLGDVKDGTGSFTVAKQKMARMLKSSQNGQGEGIILPVWSESLGSSATVALEGEMPLSIGLDLSVQSRGAITKGMTIDFKSSSERPTTTDKDWMDRSLEISLLGDVEGTAKFGLTSISPDNETSLLLPVSFPEPENGLLPNESQTFRITPENIRLGGNLSDDTWKICFSYGKVLEAESVQKHFPQYSATGGAVTVVKTALGNLLKAVYFVTSNWDIDREFGFIYTGKQDQFGISFSLPDFSPSNLTGDLIWKLEEEKVP